MTKRYIPARPIAYQLGMQDYLDWYAKPGITPMPANPFQPDSFNARQWMAGICAENADMKDIIYTQ